MRRVPRFGRFAILFFAFVAVREAVATTAPPQPGLRPFAALHWRLIGPFRGGRTVAVSGVPARPGVFYMAPNDGGVWKSIDYGRTWNPIFDATGTGSVGALAVAPTNPDIVYVGSGEGLRRPDLSTGDGMYRSNDAGATWTHQGLRDGQQINAVAVDPHDAERLFVAVVGHPYGPSGERGLFRSVDGGASYQKVLGDGTDQGAVTVLIDPNDSKVVYAALWSSRNGPWNLTQVYERYDQDGLYKSSDGGEHWSKLGGGLPVRAGRIGLTVAPSDSKRLYAIVEEPEDHCGVFRSDDGGASWTLTDSEERVCGRAEDFAGITADPANRDTVYSANTSTYRSIDAGKSWTAIKGAPGGDDYHTVWIDPTDSNIILLGVDQGATLSTDGGATWSSWYNQPTAQFYHVIADDRFPYRVFGGQQESGSAEVSSRGNDGAITFREFHPVGVEEYGYVAPDPLHPWLIYGGKVTVYDERTGQTEDVSPTYDRKRYRFDRTNPLVWNRVERRTLYLGLNVVFATRDGGRTWKAISPDLTRPNPSEPATLADFASDDPKNGKHRGVIYSLAPSYVDAKLIWAGTDDGLVWITRDGGAHWRDVTPPALGPWSRVTQIDASHFDPRTAYVSVSRQRLDDRQPYIYATHDGGATWQRRDAGIPADEPVNAVREDAKRPGLLFAATEKTVHVSFDDGRSWHSLQDNLPTTSIRDVIEHGDDLVVGTHGRSFWILDDIEPLRHMIEPLRQTDAKAGSADTRLFPPAEAYRVRANTNPDTPLPPEEPVGENPPDGAIIDYTVGADIAGPAASAGPLRITISDATGRVVRSFASTDVAPTPEPDLDIPTYWIAPPAIPPATPGDHRFIWDLHETAPRALSGGYPIAAIVHATPHEPRGVLVLPGTYSIHLSVGGRTFVQPLSVRMDPRVPATPSDLRAQYALGRRAAAGIDRSATLFDRATLRKDTAAAARARSANERLTQLYLLTQGADAAPTAVATAAIDRLLAETRADSL